MNERTVGHTYIHSTPEAAAFDHLPLHRLWAFAKLLAELGVPEHTHILECETCRHALLTCLQSENFGAVLKELNPEGGSGMPSGGKPRLRVLYLVPGSRR